MRCYRRSANEPTAAPSGVDSVVEGQGAVVGVALRATVTAASALVVAASVGIASTFPPLFSFTAAAGTTVLVMGGTGDPLSTPPDTIDFVQDYTSAAVENYVSPASTVGVGVPSGPYNTVAVITPEESTEILESIAEGLDALDSCIGSAACDYNAGIGSSAPSPSDAFVVFGYSQSAAIAMLEKRKLAAEYAAGEGPDVTFVVIGNARPNGGLVARDVGGVFNRLVLGVTRDQLVTEPAPTDTQYATVDIALQYDLFADAPLNPLNLLAVLNAYMGMLELHPNYTDYSLSGPGVVDQGQYGDTHYYLISTPVLPLLMPLQKLGLAGAIAADVADPVLRVIIETAYDRSASPGVPTPWNLLYGEDPLTIARDLLVAVPTGLDNGIEDLAGVRPFGTERPGAYGVGGTEVSSGTSEPADTSSSATPKAASSGGTSGVAQSRRSVPPAASATGDRKSADRPASSTPKSSTSSAHRGIGSSKRAS